MRCLIRTRALGYYNGAGPTHKRSREGGQRRRNGTGVRAVVVCCVGNITSVCVWRRGRKDQDGRGVLILIDLGNLQKR